MLDIKDMKIIEALQKEARLSFSELGRQIGLSQPAVSERVKRLEESGVIAGYHARIDPQKLGLNLKAIIRLRSEHRYIQKCLEKFSEMPQVIEVQRITGEDCFILTVLVPVAEQLEGIIDTIAQFGSVSTSIVIRSEPSKILGQKVLKMLKA